MPDGKPVKVRPLPDGSGREGQEAGWTGSLLRVIFADQLGSAALPPRTPVEVEAEANIYLGEVEESSPSDITVQVEHSLERSQIARIRDVWD